MKCSSCEQRLDTLKTGFILCPQCGTVNIGKSEGPKHHRPAFQHFKRMPLITASITVAVIIVVLAGMLDYYNGQANAILRTAQNTIARGDYLAADGLLERAEKYFSLSSTKKQIRELKSQNKRWIVDNSNLEKAAKLVEQGKLSDAKTLVAQISQDFPGRDKVTQLLKNIEAREAKLRKTAPAPTQSRSPTTRSKSSASSASQQNCFRLESRIQRSTADLTDDKNDYQIHIIYALPSDGADHQYDINGSLATSVSAWNNWLCKQTGGKIMKLDTYGGALDVSFVRFNASNNDIKTGKGLPYSTNPNNNPYVREDIEIRLKKLGFTDPKKLYAVYYDGTSNYSCGGGAWPPLVTGHVAAAYLHGGQPSWPVPCESNSLSGDLNTPGYFEFDILHETMHTLGFVASCAPHHVSAGHTSDSNTDLMYQGSQPWLPSVLDVNRNDYYNAGRPGCLDLANSAFFSGGGKQLPPNW